MEEYFQSRPYLIKAFFAAQFQYTAQDGQHPRRDAADIRNVLVQRHLCNFFTFDLEIAGQGYFFGRSAEMVYKGADVFYQDRAQVTYEAVWQVIVRSMAATQYQGTAVEKPAFRIVLQVGDDAVRAAAVVSVAQDIVADRYKFALVIGRAG